MRKRDFDRWVILTLGLYQGQLWVEYEDEIGNRRSIPSYFDGLKIPADWDRIPVPLVISPPYYPPDFPRDMVVPRDLSILLRSGFEDQSDGRPHWSSSGAMIDTPWLLPVFVKPAPVLEARHWEDLLMLTLEIPEQCVLMRLARRPWQARVPTPLPLKVADASRPAGRWLTLLKERSWYQNEEIVPKYGLRLERLIHPRLWTSGAQILLSRFDTAEWYLREVGRIKTVKARPRLIIVLTGRKISDAWTLLAAKIPRGSSLLILRMPSPEMDYEDQKIGEITQEFIYALVHDFALHEIVYLMKRIFPGLEAFLACDPAGNQDLRMSRAVRRIIDKSLELSHPLQVGDPQSFLERLGRGLASSLRPFIDAEPLHWQGITDISKLASQFSFDFSMESRGLVPIADFLARFAPVRRSAAQLANRLKTMQLDSKILDEVARHQMRRVDMVLEEYDAFGVLRPMNEYSRQQALRSGWRYRLRLHIGHRDLYSAVEGEVPSIDPLLPEIDRKESHEIDVVVYPKSFELLSLNLQKLRLPKMGGSKPVFFELRAPEKPGAADLRIALYHRNNLLQSFELKAAVADEPDRQWQEESQVLIRLTFSGTASFSNLDELGDPALSIALNQDGGAPTHTLMFKQGKIGRGQFVTEAQVQKHMGDFRNLLEEAAPLFPIDAALDKNQKAGFEGYLRKFAALGENIWQMLVADGDNKVLDALESILQTKGETIQVIRHGKALPFPWQLIYDYKLPKGPGFRDARVCTAEGPVRQPASRLNKGCPHCPGEDVICIEGFWSVRHYIEQLTDQDARDTQLPDTYGGADQAAENRVTKITLPKVNPSVCLGMGVDDQAARMLKKNLKTHWVPDLSCCRLRKICCRTLCGRIRPDPAF